MAPSNALSRAVSTALFKKDVQDARELGYSRAGGYTTILGKAQESLYAARNFLFGGQAEPSGARAGADMSNDSLQPVALPDTPSFTPVVRKKTMTSYKVNLGKPETVIQREMRKHGVTGVSGSGASPDAEYSLRSSTPTSAQGAYDRGSYQDEDNDQDELEQNDSCDQPGTNPATPSRCSIESASATGAAGSSATTHDSLRAAAGGHPGASSLSAPSLLLSTSPNGTGASPQFGRLSQDPGRRGTASGSNACGSGSGAAGPGSGGPARGPGALLGTQSGNRRTSTLRPTQVQTEGLPATGVAAMSPVHSTPSPLTTPTSLPAISGATHAPPHKAGSSQGLNLNGPGLGASSEPGLGRNSSRGASPRGAAAGRWYQPSNDDLQDMLAGGDQELVAALMASGMQQQQQQGPPSTAGGSRASPFLRAALEPQRANGAVGHSEESSGGSGTLHLPRLGTEPDRSASASEVESKLLDQLHKVQDNLQNHIAQRRASVTVRRSSMLEALAGSSQQPKWHLTYNHDAYGSHADTVNANRKSELDKAHLTKQARSMVAPAEASAVVARARRLSTVAM